MKTLNSFLKGKSKGAVRLKSCRYTANCATKKPHANSTQKDCARKKEEANFPL